MNLLNFPSHWNVVKRFFRPRNSIKILAIFLAVLTYHLIFEYKAPAENFLRRLTASSDTLRVHSGAGGGFYVKMGEYLEKEDHTIKGSFEIQAENSNGSLDNLNRVLTQSNSLGFVNEITSPPQDYSRSQINYVCPLYMERLHIFYNKKSLQSILADHGVDPSKKEDWPVLKIHPDELTRVFLNNAIINAGPHGSGTRLLASYILNAIEGFEQRTFMTDNNKQAKINFRQKEMYDIHFAVVGDPIELFEQLLQDPNFGMISIDAALMSKVNVTHDLNLRFADFKDKYSHDDVDHITTVGSYVNLVASSDVQASDIVKVLQLLDRAEPQDFKLTTEKYQLSEMDFAGIIAKLNEEKTSLLQSGLLFLLSVSATTIAIIWFLVTAISKSKLSRYYRDITEIYQDHLVFKHQLSIHENGLKVPVIRQSVGDRINGLNEGFFRINEVINTAFVDYKNGGITESDYKDLLKEFHTLFDDFQVGLERRLIHALESGYQVSHQQLDSYYYAGFVSREAHLGLSAIFFSPIAKPQLTKVDSNGKKR